MNRQKLNHCAARLMFLGGRCKCFATFLRGKGPPDRLAVFRATD